MRLKITRSKNDAIYYAIKSTYINGKHSSKVVMNLGKESELRKEHSDPEKWAREYLAELSEQEKSKSVRLEFSATKQLKKDQTQLYNGGYLFLQQIYHDLGLDRLCLALSRKHNFEYDLNSIFSRLLYGRILHPSSKRETAQFSETLLEQPKFTQAQVYRALDILAGDMDSIQAALYKNSLNYAQRNDRCLYYDCTNFYFEIEEESDERQYGFSKEHRPNPIIQFGLLMDGDGIPLAFCLNPGNTSEQVTLKPLEQQIMRDFQHSKFVVCTDAGLSSIANRKFNSIGGRHFVTAQSIKKMKALQKDWALDPAGWRIVGSNTQYDLNAILNSDELKVKYEKQIFYKERWFNESGLEQRCIVSFSIRYMEYLRSVRERQIQRAMHMLEHPSSMQHHRENDARRFVNVQNTTPYGELAEYTAYSLNSERVAQEEQYDGFYCVATNLDDSVERILEINKRRWEIEECFRIMKHEFKSRPVYLQRKNRIRAHFLTCYVALILFRYLEKHLKSQFSCEQIIQTLRDMQFHKVPGEGWIPVYTRTDLTDALHDTFGFHTDFEFILNADMKKICSSTKKKKKYSLF